MISFCSVLMISAAFTFRGESIFRKFCGKQIQAQEEENHLLQSHSIEENFSPWKTRESGSIENEVFSFCSQLKMKSMLK